MQSLAVRRTSKALTQLFELQPKTAIQVTVAGNNIKDWDPKKDPYEETIVPLASIRKGDIVKVLKGSSVPGKYLMYAFKVISCKNLADFVLFTERNAFFDMRPKFSVSLQISRWSCTVRRNEC